MLPEGTCSTHGPVVSGIPKPEVAWFLEGVPVRRREGVIEIYEDGASHYLCLRRTRMRDSGRYSCTASNILGHVSCSWTLLVEREYIPPTPMIQAVQFLQLRTLDCSCHPHGQTKGEVTAPTPRTPDSSDVYCRVTSTQTFPSPCQGQLTALFFLGSSAAQIVP